jgi:hypothetical protein
MSFHTLSWVIADKSYYEVCGSSMLMLLMVPAVSGLPIPYYLGIGGGGGAWGM